MQFGIGVFITWAMIVITNMANSFILDTSELCSPKTSAKIRREPIPLTLKSASRIRTSVTLYVDKSSAADSEFEVIFMITSLTLRSI